MGEGIASNGKGALDSPDDLGVETHGDSCGLIGSQRDVGCCSAYHETSTCYGNLRYRDVRISGIRQSHILRCRGPYAYVSEI